MMDEVKNTKICVPVVDVLYDFQYTAKDKREISMRKGEKLYLIEKTNKDWWQVVRQSERRSFYVPAQYVRVVAKEKLPLGHLELPSGNRSKKVEYENLNPLNAKLRENIPLNKHSSAVEANSRVDNELVKSAQVSNQKPVPKTRTKVSMSRVNYEYSSSGKSSVPELPPSECDSGARYDVSRYGDKKSQDLSLGIQKKSDHLTHVLNENEPRSYKAESEEVKNVVPKARSKMNTFSENETIESNKNRMKSSYNLRVKPSKSFEIHQKTPVKYSKKESTPTLKSDARSLSRSLEKLAQEIKFQPKEIEPCSGVPALSHHSSSDEACRKLKKPSNNNNNNIISNNNIEKKIQKGEDSQSKGSVFTRLRRSLHHSGSFKSNNFKKLNKNDKKACELSLSWEGGLDKALELEKNKTQQITPSGLQRSRTFMVAERSPTIFRHGGSIYQGRNRVDIAYHSQKPPEVKNVLSTFKPIGKIEEVQTSVRVKHSNDCRSPAKERAMFSKDEDMYVNAEVWESKRTEVYSQSESEDNSDVKCLPVPGEDQKAFRDRSSFDSNMTHSEGTEVSESDENGSLDMDMEKRKLREPLNKRRTSLMRNRRVSTTKSRTVTARQLPPTPTAEERPTKDLGNGWGVYIFDNKRNYYYNRLTGEKSWKPPRKNLSRQDNRYVGSRESICSDTSGSIIRSSTSSPSNDRILSNSLNRSNASLSSRSTGCDVSGYDLSKSNSGCNLTQNRSSQTSSPATGHSLSSSYSVIKSSRDSLNRCSPIENIPSEDDIELHDHVYQEDNKEAATVDVRGKISEEESVQQVGEGQDEDEKRTTGVPIPPGWTEYYDDATNQFFYIHKETKQKGIRKEVVKIELTAQNSPPKKRQMLQPLCPVLEKVDFQKMCYKSITTNASQSSDEDCFREILTKIDSDITELEERMTAFQLKEKAQLTRSVCSIDTLAKDTEQNRRHSLPAEFVPITSVKPPLPPGKRRSRSFCRSSSLNKKKTRCYRKQFVTLLQVLQAIDESNDRRRNLVKEDLTLPLAEKSLPFPVDDCEAEYEAQELLLMQRVTDSLKERRRVSSDRRLGGEGVESVHKLGILKNREELNDSQRKILKELEEELRNSEAQRLLKIREDVIIDWENNYDNLHEPVVLEGKLLCPCRDPARSDMEEEMGSMESQKSVGFTNESDLSNCDLQTKISENPTSDTANEISELGTSTSEDYLACDKISVSSMSDYEDTLTTYSDFENDLIEAIHLGESWCNEKYPKERTTSGQTMVSDLTMRPGSGLDSSFAESIPDNGDERQPVKFNALPRKSASDTKLINMVEPLIRSKSADFFRDSLAEDRLRQSVSSKSIGSDIVDWIAGMRGVIFVEDKHRNDDDREEWFTSFDPEGRLYFFDELSNESSWALPDINAEGEDGKFDIQRSTTESAIPKGIGDKLTEDGEKWRHRGSSTRSSKTQSMVIESKLDFSSRDDGKTLSMPRDLTKIYGEIIRSGMLNKTKICENGKKLRKNWTPAFVVLSSTKLLFFKDAKTFHSMKPGNDCMCLNLQGAVIEKGDKISSKKNVYKVNSVDHTEVLIQTDRTSDAEEWFKDILTVIQNLPQESINSSTSSLDPNSPSKVGRNKSVKARTKDGGSMEDLSLNSEERQNKIKAKLKKFFNRRPTVDSLKKKGIWKDEPVFGCSLEQITKNRIPRVPMFVEKCIECIESKEENLKTDGLYRASGNLSQVQKIRLEVDQNNLNVLKEEEDVHVLTGSLKLFFRELKDPLIPFKQLVPALTAINNPKRKEKIKEYRKIVGALPGPNYDTLKFLLQHLLRVEKYNEFNRMNVNNLAIVFGPTLMWPEQESTNMALDFMQQNLVIECLLREFQEIFT